MARRGGAIRLILPPEGIPFVAPLLPNLRTAPPPSKAIPANSITGFSVIAPIATRAMPASKSAVDTHPATSSRCKVSTQLWNVPLSLPMTNPATSNAIPPRNIVRFIVIRPIATSPMPTSMTAAVTYPMTFSSPNVSTQSCKCPSFTEATIPSPRIIAPAINNGIFAVAAATAIITIPAKSMTTDIHWTTVVNFNFSHHAINVCSPISSAVIPAASKTPPATTIKMLPIAAPMQISANPAI